MESLDTLFNDLQIYRQVLGVYKHDSFECICQTKEHKVKWAGCS